MSVGGRGAVRTCVVEDFDAQTLKAREVEDFPRRLGDQLNRDTRVSASLHQLEGLLGFATPSYLSSEDVHIVWFFGCVG